MELTRLSDQALVARLGQLVERERSVTAALIAHLAEVWRRRLHLKLGFGSLFDYLVAELGYSEDAAYKRQRVAKLAVDFPKVLELLASGRLHLSGATVLAPHLTRANCDALLASASGQSKRTIERLVADLAPAPEVPSSIRKLPRACEPSARTLFVGAEGDADDAPSSAGANSAPPSPRRCSQARIAAGQGIRGASLADSPRGENGRPTAPRPELPRPAPGGGPVTTPLGGERFKITFTGSEVFVGKLERLKSLLSHQVPGGDLAEVLERAVDVAVAHFDKQRFGAKRASSPSASEASQSAESLPLWEAARGDEPPPPTRHIPAGVRREVFDRDGGRCTFRGPGGRRCGSTYQLELDHIVPFSRGGPHTADNLTLRCRAHNQLRAIQDFGPRAADRERGAA